ncbi:cell envelope biogenesis protein OmpA [uncultured Croceitalea sp.]|uniref:cell envelope biogenesis protein OmpA n=1 Tax=uncultured Croceitalea sp. TaxID=1798908 RepID=UPI00330626BD
MKSSPIYKLTLTLVGLVFALNLNAQKEVNETDKRIDDYLELLKQGYSEIEIFQDLGNVNFLTENYESAIFWYEKLKNNVQVGSLSSSYQERYDYAKDQLAGNSAKERKDWATAIKNDYGITRSVSAQQNAIPSIASNKKAIPSENEEFTPEMSITRDGKTAFFSKITYVKPEFGVFSKKEPVHVLYKASNVNGEWKNIQKVAVCPKYYSAKHPTVSEDGSRLFFASNMPGTYGKYDIYVSDIKSDGTLGVAKNLGPKVNTKKNDLYPSLKNGTLLFFASEGRKGYGGLDLFAVQVAKNTLTKSVNLGRTINSSSDDFSLALVPEKGMGYVMSNRGKKNKVSQIAITYSKPVDASLVEKSEEGLMKALHANKGTDYSSTVFEE